VKLTCGSGSVINCEKAAKLVITAAENTENVLTDSESYTFEDGDDEPDAAVYSKCDTVINGYGSLTVNGLYKDGIRCKDGVKICGGNVTVSAAEDGIKGKDYLIVADGNITVTSGADGLKSTNSSDETLGYIHIKGGSIDITSGNDAVQAETELIVDGGSIKAVTGGGSATVEHTSEGNFGGGGWGGKFSSDGKNPFDFDSMTSSDDSTAESIKGLKAGNLITINGGTIDIDAADDSIHSNGKVLIQGGEMKLSSGDDGVHADDNLTITDGSIYIATSYEGIEGKSIDVNGGTIELYASDDGFNAAGGDNGSFFGFGGDTSEYYISISDGNITINADGDGLDSNGSMAMSGGTVVVFGPTDSMNGAIDYETSFAVSGGTLIALGSVGMAQAPSTLSQPCLSINASVSAGCGIEVRSSDETVVLSVETPKNCQSLIFTSDKFVVGEEYSIYSEGELLSTVTAEDGISGNGANSSGFGGGFGGGGMNGGRGGGRDKSDWVSTSGEDGEMPEMPSGGFDPQNGGGDKPDNMPDNKPDDMPEMPSGDFDPNNSPEGFDPSQMQQGGDNAGQPAQDNQDNQGDIA
jgi:hypothetical protein